MLIIAIPLTPWRSEQHPKQVFNIVFESKIVNFNFKILVNNF